MSKCQACFGVWHRNVEGHPVTLGDGAMVPSNHPGASQRAVSQAFAGNIEAAMVVDASTRKTTMPNRRVMGGFMGGHAPAW